jgi:PAS domain S-box-containing protein
VIPARQPDEAERLARLRALAVLDSAPEPLFDGLARLAAQIAGTPIALVSLIDEKRLWFKANLGLSGLRELPRDLAFCAHTMLEREVMVVTDACTDPRFADHPLVIGEPAVRFYAGAPLTLPDGARVGTLCVIDRAPRQLDDAQRAQLAELAHAVVQALLLRERAQPDAAAAAVAADSQLARRERALGRILDHLPLAVSVWDRELRNVFVNERVAQRHGRSPAALVGVHLSELIGARAVEAHRAFHDAVLSGQPQAFEARHVRGGSLYLDRVQLVPLRADDGTVAGFVALTQDLWDPLAMDAAQRALADSERKYRTLADASPLGVFHTDAEGRCTYTNLRWQAIFGMSLERSLGDGWIGGLHPDDRVSVASSWSEAADAGREFEVEFRVRRPDGSVRDVHTRARALHGDDGTLCGFVGTVEDVTEARNAQRRLREVNRLLTQLYERTPAMMDSIDVDGVILSVSDRWLATTGYTRDEIVGQSVLDFFTDESRRQRERDLQQLWAQGHHTSGVLQIRRSDGRLLDIVASAIVQYDEAGRALRALVVTDDVTELLARTAELRREQVQRADVERYAAELDALLAERSEMLNVLAHEVRQPLNNASAALQSAAAALADPGSQADAAERLRRAESVMHTVMSGVDNTLAVAALLGKSGAGDASLMQADVDIDTLLAVAVGDMPVADRERVRIERVTGTRTASMDTGLLRLALRNLLANALRHSPAGSPVRLRVWDSDEPLALVLDVIDQGPGIQADLLPRLFERGTRGRHLSGRASHGLGLYIVRKALELHGGRAELVSTGPQGTTMRLWIAQAGADLSSAPGQTAASGARNQ